MGKKDIRKGMGHSQLLSSCHTSGLPDSTSPQLGYGRFSWGSLVPWKRERTRETKRETEWMSEERKGQHTNHFLCCCLFLLWPNWQRRPQISLQLTWLMESLTSMNCSVWTFKRPQSKKTWFFLLFWSEVQIFQQNKAPYLSYIEYLFEKNMQKQAAQKCSWFERH